MKIAILSGDLINSTSYEAKTLKSVLLVLKKEFKVIEKQFPSENMSFSIYRGDSFQGVIENTELALAIALQIKTAVTSYTDVKDLPKNAISSADIRISIGIEHVDDIREDITQALDSMAMVLSKV